MLSVRALPETLRSEATVRDDARDLLALVPPDAPDVFYAEHPERDVAIAGIGVVAEVRVAGTDRFAQASATSRALLESVVIEGGPAPLLVGGFAFADDDPRHARWTGFPAVRLVLPERLWMRREGLTWEIRTTGIAPARRSTPHVVGTADGDDGSPRDDRMEWRAAVERALASIAAGEIDKVVLARSRMIDASVRDPAALVARLRDARPGCVTFWVRHGARHFVGSSPETLARVEEGRAEVLALAGSARRGADAASDRAAAARLAACAKNAREHAFVTDEVEMQLRRLGVRLEPPVGPVARAVPEAWHLATAFRGTLPAGLDALGLAGALHPTPAVCGSPRAAARAFIEAIERERGWYAGGIGWMDAAGNGTFVAALRCGLLGVGAPRVWAGAGIVDGSCPDAEYDETEAKMDAMRRVLAEETARG
jgi:menaquinone-specific isochorismate synthase